VDSEIYNLAHSAQNRRTTRISVDAETPESGRYWAGMLQHQGDGPEESVMNNEALDRFRRFSDSLKGEPELEDVVLAALDGATSRSDVAEMLKVSESEVDNRRKRLKRRRRDFMELRPDAEPSVKGGIRRG